MYIHFTAKYIADKHGVQNKGRGTTLGPMSTILPCEQVGAYLVLPYEQVGGLPGMAGKSNITFTKPSLLWPHHDGVHWSNSKLYLP